MKLFNAHPQSCAQAESSRQEHWFEPETGAEPIFRLLHLVLQFGDHVKRVFKTRSFDRWAKKLVPDCLLCLAARDICDGRFEADLGHGLCKKRIAVAGRGKRGGLRALVAKRHADAIFFVLGREKNESESDFPASVVEVAKQTALDLQRLTMCDLAETIRDGRLMEICHGRKGP